MRDVIKLKNIKFKGELKSLFSKMEKLEVERIEFTSGEYNNEVDFVITPDFGGFRVHKDKGFGENGSLKITPSVSNEILIS